MWDLYCKIIIRLRLIIDGNQKNINFRKNGELYLKTFAKAFKKLSKWKTYTLIDFNFAGRNLFFYGKRFIKWINSS